MKIFVNPKKSEIQSKYFLFQEPSIRILDLYYMRRLLYVDPTIGLKRNVTFCCKVLTNKPVHFCRSKCCSFSTQCPRERAAIDSK